MEVKLFEKYTTDIEEIKNIILLKAIDTYNIDVVDFFVKKGYDINGPNVLFYSIFNSDILKYFIDNGIEVINSVDLTDYSFKKELKRSEIQKMFIDFGYEDFIRDKIGFNNDLINDPKYADIIKREEDIEKYNL